MTRATLQRNWAFPGEFKTIQFARLKTALNIPDDAVKVA
jgi:hypothetical protein